MLPHNFNLQVGYGKDKELGPVVHSQIEQIERDNFPEPDFWTGR
jgi:hypothetical protein